MTTFRTRIFTLCAVILMFVSNNNAQDIEHKQENFPILHSTKDTIDLLIKRGDSLSKLGENGLSRSNYIKAFQLARRRSDKKRLLKSGIKIVYASVELNQYSDAEETLSFIESYCNKVKDTLCLVEIKKRYGGLYHKMGDYKESLNVLNQGFSLAKNVNDDILNHNLLLARAGLLYDIENYKESKKDYITSLKYLKSTDSKRLLNVYTSLVSVYSDLNDLDSTHYYFKKATKLCDKIPENVNCYMTYNNLAYIYYENGESKKALDLISNNVNLKDLEKYKNSTMYPAFMHTLGALYHDTKDYDKAIAYFDIALEYSIKRNYIPSIVLVNEDLSKAYEALGDYKNSIVFLKKAKSLKEDYDNREIKKQIAKIESKHLLIENQKKLSNLREVNLKQGEEISKVKLFSYLLAFFLILILSTLLYHEHKNRLRFHQINEELSLNRFKSLRSMMNPHFLFNSFSTLQNYILKKESLKAIEYMTELSGLIRKVLSSSDSIYTCFSKELELLKSYINIEKGRFEESFEAVYNIDERILDTNPTIPSMIVQPYIENAIIHGFSHANKKGLLELSFKKENDAIICTIEDNGIGREEAERLKKKGSNAPHLSIATRNTNERLRILNKIGSHNAGVRINDLFFESGTPKGTEVVITLPINQKRK